MNKATAKRAGSRLALGLLLATLTGGVCQGQDLRVSSMGRIEALSLESGQVVIGGRVYALEMRSLTVVHQERVLEPSVLRPGMDVAFGTGRSRDGRQTVVRTVKILGQDASLQPED